MLGDVYFGIMLGNLCSTPHNVDMVWQLHINFSCGLQVSLIQATRGQF